MKKISLFSSILLGSLVLFGCSDNENTALLTEDAFEEIESSYYSDGNFVIDSMNEVDFTDSSRNEILVISNSDENSKVEIFSYSDDEKDWSTIYSSSSHENYDGLENLYFVDSFENGNLDHAVVGYSGGNSSTLNFEILAYNPNTKSVDIVLDKMFNEYTNSKVSFEENTVSIYSDHNDELLESYSWNNQSYLLNFSN